MHFRTISDSRVVLDDVAHLGRTSAAECGRCGVIVDFGDRGNSDFVGDRLDHFARRGILHDAHLPADFQFVADIQGDSRFSFELL